MVLNLRIAFAFAHFDRLQFVAFGSALAFDLAAAVVVVESAVFEFDFVFDSFAPEHFEAACQYFESKYFEH